MLTDLPNRRLLIERLEQALARARGTRAAVAVLLLDLDNFKVINDSLGHGGGDELLRALTPRLRAAARECDTVARLGRRRVRVRLRRRAERGARDRAGTARRARP